MKLSVCHQKQDTTNLFGRGIIKLTLLGVCLYMAREPSAQIIRSQTIYSINQDLLIWLLGQMYCSVKPYKAQKEDELSFPVGVILQVIRKNLDGWWTAM